MLGAFWDQILQLFGGLCAVAQEIQLGMAGDGFIQAFCQLQKGIAIRFLQAFKFLEALVAGDHEKIVLTLQQVSQLFPGLQLIFGIVFQSITSLFSSAKKAECYIPRIFLISITYIDKSF